ncbi:MAG: bifunctional glutamate N-acetyltransferase/amino-acid acetyltransferase ArgJ [Candidatus Dormibacteria bacterium]
MNTEVAIRPVRGLTAPQGFLCGVAAAGIKGGEVTRDDVAVLYSEFPATAAAVFTTNLVKAAPVVISQLNLADGRARALVVNSGNANACNGSQGFKDALLMAKLCADAMDLAPSDVVVASTGVIGRPMPMDRVAAGIKAAAGALSIDAGPAAARAIMTTDTVAKEAVASFVHRGRTVTVGGIAKGSGMIHINMATMLGFLTTDAEVPAALLREVVRRVSESTFNMVTVDGDTSTNDMLAVFANGASGSGPLARDDGIDAFEAAVEQVCRELSRAIARDGEGATRLLTVNVTGAADDEDARRAARTVTSSNLVKAAIHGADPNWGRIVAALGRSGCALVLDRVRVEIGNHAVFDRGSAIAEVNLAEVRDAFASDEVVVDCDLGLGEGRATAWGCDLSAEYVHINADYTT